MSKIGRANDPALRVLTQDNGATAKLGDFLSEQQRAFLLSTEAKSVQPSEALRFSEGEAKERFAAIRWSQNGGKPTCTKCGNSDRHYPSQRDSGVFAHRRFSGRPKAGDTCFG